MPHSRRAIPFSTNSQKERAISQYSPIAFIDMTIRMMAYPLTLGSISWALSWVISYLRLTYEITTTLQLYIPFGLALGALALKVTMVAIAARFLIAAISQLFGLGLGGRRNGYSDGLRGAMKGLAMPIIIAGVITLVAGIFNAGPSFMELVNKGVEASLNNPWLVVLLPFYEYAAGKVLGIALWAVLLVILAGYWLASKLGLDTTKMLYNKTRQELMEAEIARRDAFFGPDSPFHSSNKNKARQKRMEARIAHHDAFDRLNRQLHTRFRNRLLSQQTEAEIAHRDAFFGPDSAFHSSNLRQGDLQDDVSIHQSGEVSVHVSEDSTEVGSSHTMHEDSNAIRFTHVLSDTVTAILGGVVDAVVPGR